MGGLERSDQEVAPTSVGGLERSDQEGNPTSVGGLKRSDQEVAPTSVGGLERSDQEGTPNGVWEAWNEATKRGLQMENLEHMLNSERPQQHSRKLNTVTNCIPRQPTKYAH